MANRGFSQQFLYSFTPMLTSLHGSIDVAASTSGVTATNIVGATAARTGTGEITITFVDKWNFLKWAAFQILSATAQDRVVQIKSFDLSAKTMVLELLAGATATDPASACTIYCNIFVSNSSVTK